MTPRPPVRMCVRCRRTTDAPVLIHAVHAATGPGFNVYACQACATLHPPPTDALELLDTMPRPSPSRMTIRAYRVTAEGTEVEDRRETRTWTGSSIDPPPSTSTCPTCTCPRCRPA
ncbi:hypothetical protein IPZ68_29435 [Streptomyces arenae]|nr:hypothetical protein [Streptomyces arenae]